MRVFHGLKRLFMGKGCLKLIRLTHELMRFPHDLMWLPQELIRFLHEWMRPIQSLMRKSYLFTSKPLIYSSRVCRESVNFIHPCQKPTGPLCPNPSAKYWTELILLKAAHCGGGIYVLKSTYIPRCFYSIPILPFIFINIFFQIWIQLHYLT